VENAIKETTMTATVTAHQPVEAQDLDLSLLSALSSALELLETGYRSDAAQAQRVLARARTRLEYAMSGWVRRGR
jgi:glycogen debranching enzyme